MKVYIARHGETEWNKTKRVMGWLNSELTEKGKQHAINLVRLLKEKNITAIYSSDMQRAVDTAKPLATELGLDIIPDSCLRECSYGILEGEIKEKSYPEIWNEREKDEYKYVLPGGESLELVYKNRVISFLERIIPKHAEDNILIVGHKGTNRLLIAYLLDKDPEEIIRTMEFPHNVVYAVEPFEKKILELGGN